MPAMRPRHFQLASQNGFTLVELIIVIVVLGIVSAYAVMKGVSVAEVTLPSQAQKMASDIRHAQTLAYTSGKRMCLAITAGTYSVNCGNVESCLSSSCPSQSFSVILEKGVVLSVAPTIDFNTLGQPNDAASYTMSVSVSDSANKIISVAALTGHVTVSP